MGEDAEWLENCCCTRQPDGLTEPLAVQLWKAEETFLSISSFKFKFEFKFNIKTVGAGPHRTMLNGVPNPLFKFKFNTKTVGAGPHRVKGRKRGP
jgi:hypothetical protein